jgi:hypothetical protein
MPENITVTLKMEKPGGLWPFLRGAFAWIGFAVVVVAGVNLLDTPNPSPERAIEAMREGLEAYRIKPTRFNTPTAKRRRAIPTMRYLLIHARRLRCRSSATRLTTITARKFAPRALTRPMQTAQSANGRVSP